MRIIDLFSGAGGLTFGFYYRLYKNRFVRNKKNLFVFANEFNKSASDAFSVNYPDITMLNSDIKDLTEDQIKKLVGEDPVDIIIGGPPCQSYSTVGPRNYDERAVLYQEYSRILGIVRPKMFLFENVRGILSMREVFYKKDENGNISIDWINEDLITFVKDRLGHDQRYAIDPTKITNALGWYPETKFEVGIVKTIEWYLANQAWVEEVTSGDYQGYYEKMYGK